MSDHSTYESPLCGRYASKEMQHLFSADTRYSTWRLLWVALAEAEQKLGLSVTDEQLAELRAHVCDIDYDVVAAKEAEIRHDVMAHVYAYGLKCPAAAGIIHLGATSCYVTDNADLIIYRDALKLIRHRLLCVIANLADFADRWKAQPMLGYTHFQPAQPVTVGKRFCLYLQDLLMDLGQLDYCIGALRLLGSKGTTGTQASFLELFDGDHAKCRKLDRLIAEKFGFSACFPVAGQTYPRKLDSLILESLSAIAQSGHRFATDMRLMQHEHEVEEPFEKGQVGSSAMAYKRNPMRCERICSLARYVICDAQNGAMTASVQWLERTLDDSANRRISLPESFLATDALLLLMQNVTDGLVVYEKVLEKNLAEYLPFLATENLLMAAVKQGADRQQMHELIRRHSMDAVTAMKTEGRPCDLLQRLADDPAFVLDAEQLAFVGDAKHYIGRCPEQVDEFLDEEVHPALLGLSERDKPTINL